MTVCRLRRGMYRGPGVRSVDWRHRGFLRGLYFGFTNGKDGWIREMSVRVLYISLG